MGSYQNPILKWLKFCMQLLLVVIFTADIL